MGFVILLVVSLVLNSVYMRCMSRFITIVRLSMLKRCLLQGFGVCISLFLGLLVSDYMVGDGITVVSAITDLITVVFFAIFSEILWYCGYRDARNDSKNT